MSPHASVLEGVSTGRYVVRVAHLQMDERDALRLDTVTAQ